MVPLVVLTIGQAPRPDLVEELRSALGPDRWPADAIEVRGALDGLDDDEIARAEPTGDDDALHTRLPSGRDVVVSKTFVTTRLADLIVDGDDHPCLVACTGRFDGLPSRPNLIFPSVVLDGLIDACLPSGSTLGVLVPLPEQIEPFTEARGRSDRPAVVAAVKPGADPTAAAERLRAGGVDLTVLDCFGYDQALLAQVRSLTGRPVLSAVRATGALLAELLGTTPLASAGFEAGRP